MQKLFYERVSSIIGDFKMDNLKDEKGEDIYGLFQESYNPYRIAYRWRFQF